MKRAFSTAFVDLRGTTAVEGVRVEEVPEEPDEVDESEEEPYYEDSDDETECAEDEECFLEFTHGHYTCLVHRLQLVLKDVFEGLEEMVELKKVSCGECGICCFNWPRRMISESALSNDQVCEITSSSLRAQAQERAVTCVSRNNPLVIHSHYILHIAGGDSGLQ